MSGDTMLYIMTTAHIFDHLFMASDPLQGSIMDMFEVSFLCQHFEQDYQQYGLHEERKYVKRYILAADILIMGVPTENLKKLAM
jgi:hypothetical protein